MSKNLSGPPEKRSSSIKRRKKKPGKKPTSKIRHKKPKKKSTTWVLILIFLALGGVIWGTLHGGKESEITKKYNLTLSALDKAYWGCMAYWEGIGMGYGCTQSVLKRVLSQEYQKIKITILKARSHNFAAQATYKGIPKTFQINHDGEVFLNVDGCLSKVMVRSLTPENMQTLENKCTATAQPSQS